MAARTSFIIAQKDEITVNKAAALAKILKTRLYLNRKRKPC
jgi:hypothetical protein